MEDESAPSSEQEMAPELPPASGLGGFWAELSRRKVLKVVLAYLAFAWLIIQVASIIFPAFGISSFFFQAIIIAFFLGFPIVSFLAWTYEWTAKGIVRDEGEVLPKALEKARGRTLDFAIIGALVLALSVLVAERFLRSSQGTQLIDSIAVLPLVNLSGDPTQEYFADGMTEAFITKLSQISALKVVSRTSVMKYKNTNLGLPEIAAALGVKTILAGSAIYHQGKVRINAQLIDAKTDRHLWVETYDRDMEDILALQSEVALGVAREVALTLTPNEASRLQETRKVNKETYEDYLRGMYYINQETPEGFKKGLAILDAAIERDPADPLAYAGLALGYARITHTPAPPAEPMQKALAAALKALKLDPELSQAWHALGNVKLYHEWDYVGAEHALLKAIELDPNHAEAHYDYAWYLVLLGRMDEAVDEHRLAQELDPFQPMNTAWLGGLYQLRGELDLALVEAEKALEIDPEYAQGYLVLGDIYFDMGMVEKAIETHKKMVTLAPYYEWLLGVTYAKAGETEKALEIVSHLKKESEDPNKAWPPLGIGVIQFFLGNYEESAKWIVREPHQGWLAWYMHAPPFRAKLSAYPEYRQLLERMPLPAGSEMSTEL